ncbi:MAG: RluA family pseudouridine synthase [Patescibacteria group bacterium]|nr:RluA family pseudouridine synthase [Patescibacteria group bacterium]
MKILYEDKNIVAVNKEAGLLTYAPVGKKVKEKTLLNLVWPHLEFAEKGERSGVVHRLDRETSGVIVFAKNEEYKRLLQEAFKARKVEKRYLTLVSGKLEPKEGKIEIPLGRAPKDRLKVVPKASGKPSVTLYRVIRYFPENKVSLVEVVLKTGRMHQIRVHFAAIGHPVVGDVLYGRRDKALSRQFLHAVKLAFTEPKMGKKLSFEAELPEDLKTFLKALS